jgi:pimeloyl-ACP methyl ester carboxylesterase
MNTDTETPVTASAETSVGARASTDRIEPAAAGERPINVLVVEAGTGDARPVLLFLHGKGEASPWLNQLAHVCDHQSPPFQAMLGRLQAVTVVAPQAPYNMAPRPGEPDETGWDWRPHLAALCRYLRAKYAGRRVVAAGFSRGGLGVLQLMSMSECRGLVTKWAVVDPQRAEPGEEQKILPAGPDASGWLRYTDDLKQRNVPFAKALAGRLPSGPDPFRPGLKHSGIAMKAFGGEPVGQPGGEKQEEPSLYEHLGLDFRGPTPSVPAR